VQLFLPGVPQIYYVGLLAGENDMALLRQTGVGRDINRHRYSREQVEAALQKPVVQALLELIRARNRCKAFDGTFQLDAETDARRMAMHWTLGEHTATLRVDFDTLDCETAFSD